MLKEGEGPRGLGNFPSRSWPCKSDPTATRDLEGGQYFICRPPRTAFEIPSTPCPLAASRRCPADRHRPRQPLRSRLQSVLPKPRRTSKPLARTHQPKDAGRRPAVPSVVADAETHRLGRPPVHGCAPATCPGAEIQPSCPRRRPPCPPPAGRSPSSMTTSLVQAQASAELHAPPRRRRRQPRRFDEGG